MSECTIIFKHLQIMHRGTYLCMIYIGIVYLYYIFGVQSSRSRLAHFLVYNIPTIDRRLYEAKRTRGYK